MYFFLYYIHLYCHFKYLTVDKDIKMLIMLKMMYNIGLYQNLNKQAMSLMDFKFLE